MEKKKDQAALRPDEQGEEPSPFTAIGVPACTAHPVIANFTKTSLLLLFPNIPAGGIRHLQ
ncbi:MAG: hypothetical protein ACU0DI_10910 [Paracoccaceae bacterium]